MGWANPAVRGASTRLPTWRPWGVRGMSVGRPWGFGEVSVGCLCGGFNGISVGHMPITFGASVERPWSISGVSVGRL